MFSGLLSRPIWSAHWVTEAVDCILASLPWVSALICALHQTILTIKLFPLFVCVNTDFYHAAQYHLLSHAFKPFCFVYNLLVFAFVVLLKGKPYGNHCSFYTLNLIFPSHLSIFSSRHVIVLLFKIVAVPICFGIVFPYRIRLLSYPCSRISQSQL